MATAIRGGGVYKTLFEEEAILELPEGEKKQGRDVELLAARNELILYRFVYIGRTRPEMKYEFIIKELVRAFFLSDWTIGKIIEDHRDVLHRIRKEGLDVKALKEKYVDYSWR